MTDETSASLRKQLSFRNYNVKTGQPFTVSELISLKGDDIGSNTSILNFSKEIKEIDDRFMDKYKDCKRKLEEKDFDSFLVSENKEDQDDWQEIAEFEEVLSPLKRKLTNETKRAIVEISKSTK